MCILIYIPEIFVFWNENLVSLIQAPLSLNSIFQITKLQAKLWKPRWKYWKWMNIKETTWYTCYENLKSSLKFIIIAWKMEFLLKLERNIDTLMVFFVVFDFQINFPWPQPKQYPWSQSEGWSPDAIDLTMSVVLGASSSALSNCPICGNRLARGFTNFLRGFKRISQTLSQVSQASISLNNTADLNTSIQASIS